MFKVSETHYAATWLLHEQAPKVTPPDAVFYVFVKKEGMRMSNQEREVLY